MANGHPESGVLTGRLGRVVEVLENTLIVLLLTGMIGLAGGQILLRNVWGTSIIWGDPLLRVAVLWIGLLGAMTATRYDKHIRINVLQRFVPPRFANINRMITDVFTAAVCGTVSYYAVKLVLLEREAGGNAFASVPAWVCELIIPIGFAVMTLRFLQMFLQRLAGARTIDDDRMEGP
jgi:TRAP-type C4-dicarboxylate transport system permease small subunit